MVALGLAGVKGLGDDGVDTGCAEHDVGSGPLEISDADWWIISKMAKYELTKSIDAKKLNKRTMNPLGPERFPIPFGAILTDLKEERGLVIFHYLGEPFEAIKQEVGSAIKEIE